MSTPGGEDHSEVITVLTPLMGRWAISDDAARAAQVQLASREDLERLVATVDSLPDDALYGWLSGPESYATAPSDDYLAVSAICMAADQARVILNRPLN